MQTTTALLFLLAPGLLHAQVPATPNTAQRGGCEPPTVVTPPPATIEICQGETVELTVVATGTDLHYSWGQNGSEVGTDAATFDLGPFPGMHTTITCVISGQCGQTNIGDIDVHATPVPQPYIGESGGQLVCYGPATQYQWFLNGAEIPGATGESYTPTENGNYYVKAWNGDCVGVSPSYYYGSTGVAEGSAAQDRLRWSPGGTYLWVSPADPSSTLQVFDQNGRCVRSIALPAGPSAITIGDLPAGVYVARMDGRTERFVR